MSELFYCNDVFLLSDDVVLLVMTSQELLVGADSWSMSELVQAMAIMAHYHALACFCLGCGINPEIDTPVGHTYKDSDLASSASSYSNPALGVGKLAPSDSESETISPIGQSPISPTQNDMARRIVEHYIDSKFISQSVMLC